MYLCRVAVLCGWVLLLEVLWHRCGVGLEGWREACGRMGGGYLGVGMGGRHLGAILSSRGLWRSDEGMLGGGMVETLREGIAEHKCEMSTARPSAHKA